MVEEIGLIYCKVNSKFEIKNSSATYCYFCMCARHDINLLP